MADPAIQLKTLDALASAIGEITDLRRDLAVRDARITKLGLMLDAAHEETRRAIASYDFERDCLTDRIAEREGLFREAMQRSPIVAPGEVVGVVPKANQYALYDPHNNHAGMVVAPKPDGSWLLFTWGVAPWGVRRDVVNHGWVPWQAVLDACGDLLTLVPCTAEWILAQDMDTNRTLLLECEAQKAQLAAYKAGAAHVVEVAILSQAHKNPDQRLGQLTYNMLRSAFNPDDVNQTPLDCFERQAVGDTLIQHCLDSAADAALNLGDPK